MGYFLCVLLEIVSTTLLRMATFLIYEQSIFNLLPNVPFFVLPWTLKEHRYRPKRITLFAADIVTSCVSSPIIEEYIKLKLVQWSVSLPRNFCKRKDRGKHNKVATKNKKRKKDVMEPIVRSSHESDVTNINSYVTHFLAVSLGLKLCDSIRRILMYTKKSNANKAFYALCRGGYPIHELCGIMTALQLVSFVCCHMIVIGSKICYCPLYQIMEEYDCVHFLILFVLTTSTTLLVYYHNQSNTLIYNNIG